MTKKVEETYTDEIGEAAFKLALLGMPDSAIAEFVGINRGTLAKWKKTIPEFRMKLFSGREMADARVAHALFQRAVGYSHEDLYITTYQGEVIVRPVMKHYPPDVKAITLWLTNRQKQQWSTRPNIIDITPSGPINIINLGGGVPDPDGESRRQKEDDHGDGI